MKGGEGKEGKEGGVSRKRKEGDIYLGDAIQIIPTTSSCHLLTICQETKEGDSPRAAFPRRDRAAAFVRSLGDSASRTQHARLKGLAFGAWLCGAAEKRQEQPLPPPWTTVRAHVPIERVPSISMTFFWSCVCVGGVGWTWDEPRESIVRVARKKKAGRRV